MDVLWDLVRFALESRLIEAKEDYCTAGIWRPEGSATMWMHFHDLISPTSHHITFAPFHDMPYTRTTQDTIMSTPVFLRIDKCCCHRT